ncbi:MAG: FkbM family methyltransferase [Gammaproteobacteria bacterium]|nr:FkbM family methyltransferase [Gammaproteobacteria bacterium]
MRLALAIRRLALILAGSPLDVMVDNFRLRSCLGDNVSERKYVFMPRSFDPSERALIVDELPPDGVFVDIGANVGIYTLTAASVLGPVGRIIAFEPCPATYERLRFNININRDSMKAGEGIALLPMGVSDRSGEFDLFLDSTNLGGNSLQKRRDDDQSMKIECTPLLNALRGQKIGRVDILKIDIEGAEEQALVPFFSDAPRALLPQVIIMENSNEERRAALVQTMYRLGYVKTDSLRMNSIYRLMADGP